MKTVGQVCYEKLLDCCSYRDPLTKHDLPVWCFLPDEIKRVWEEIGQAAQEFRPEDRS